MYSVLGIREQDNRVWKHVICIENVGASAYTPFGCDGRTSPRYKVECFAPCCKISKKSIGIF